MNKYTSFKKIPKISTQSVAIQAENDRKRKKKKTRNLKIGKYPKNSYKK